MSRSPSLKTALESSSVASPNIAACLLRVFSFGGGSKDSNQKFACNHFSMSAPSDLAAGLGNVSQTKLLLGNASRDAFELSINILRKPRPKRDSFRHKLHLAIFALTR